MNRRRMCIAIAALTTAIALILLQANASLVPEPFGFGGKNNNPASQEIISPPTQAQKEAAIKIASTSPLCKQYNTYPDESWNFGWDGQAPANNIINMFKELPDTDFLEFVVDLNTNSIVSATVEPSIGEQANPTDFTNTDASTIGTTSTTPFLSGSLMSFPASAISNFQSTSPPIDNSQTIPVNNQVSPEGYTLGHMPGLFGYYGYPCNNTPSFPFNSPLLEGDGIGTWGFGF